MEERSRSLEALFYSGAHAEVLKRTIDSPTGSYVDDEVDLVVGALVFAGRADEAATVFQSWLRARPADGLDGIERAAACRFFLCIAECRAGRYSAAERACRDTLSELGARTSSRARYYLHQGLGLVRHFTGRLASAERHARRARRHSLESRFPYGRMLALDLLGHTMVQRGRVLSGITVLSQGAELADGIGLAGLGMTTRSAIVAYRTHFGAGTDDPIEALERHLEVLGDADRYSRRLVLTELARALAFRGERDAAARTLRAAEEVALPDGDRRASVKLYLAHALLAGLSLGEDAAAEWLARATPLVDPAHDPALDADIAWHEYAVCPKRFAARSIESLAALAARTGLGRAAYLVAAKGSATIDVPPEDRFAALLARVRRGTSALDALLSSELLGLLPTCYGLPPGKRIYVDVARNLLALEEHGNVTRRPLPSASARALLRALARGPRSKESLIHELWHLKVYRPETHDAVVHTAISRLRVALEPHSTWVRVTSSGYALAPEVTLVEADDIEGAAEEAAPSPEAPSEEAASATTTAEGRRETALALAARPQGVRSSELAQMFHISDMTALRTLNELTAEGSLKRTGRGRNTRYTRGER